MDAQITVRDHYVVAADRLTALRDLVNGYADGAAARGLTLVEQVVAPPLALADQPVTLDVRWTLATWAPSGPPVRSRTTPPS